jgi:glutathionylspermidine synthase
MHSREGSNIVMAMPDGQTIATDGPYTDRLQVDQRLGPTVNFSDSRTSSQRWPVLGLWMIDQECCGMGIRESPGPITGNLSSFVPHFFR